MARQPHGDGNPKRALLGEREAYCFARRTVVPFSIYQRDRLEPGDRANGPSIIDEGTSTTVIHSDQSFTVDSYGDLLVRTEVS
jgi:N-methylhydantoinase A